jgi:hypothetical protein
MDEERRHRAMFVVCVCVVCVSYIYLCVSEGNSRKQLRNFTQLASEGRMIASLTGEENFH